MKETGIIMSGSHPVDILEGRKTMTRRLWGLKEINKHPDDWELVAVFQDGLARFSTHDGSQELTVKCPYGGYGDLLWVKETWRVMAGDDNQAPCELSRESRSLVQFRAGKEPSVTDLIMGKWRPSLFMPRWASRIPLEITGIRAERLQSIKEADCIAEGCPSALVTLATVPMVNWYQHLWDSLNAKRGYGWEVNPWVWPISFKRLERAVANNAVIREGIG